MIFSFALALGGIFLGTIGCGSSTASQSLLWYWNQMDYISNTIDFNFGSSNCPMSLYNQSGFSADPFISSTYAKWKIQSNTSGGVNSFLNCSQNLQTSIGIKTTGANGNLTAFSNYSDTNLLWRVFETSFNCVGWCNTLYPNPAFNSSTNTCMNADLITPCNCTDSTGEACSTCVSKSDNITACTNYIRPILSQEKYLFSDVNNGPPINKGCLPQIINWVMPIFQVYGSIGILYSIAELVIFLLAVSICCVDDDRENDEESEISEDLEEEIESKNSSNYSEVSDKKADDSFEQSPQPKIKDPPVTEKLQITNNKKVKTIELTNLKGSQIKNENNNKNGELEPDLKLDVTDIEHDNNKNNNPKYKLDISIDLDIKQDNDLKAELKK